MGIGALVRSGHDPKERTFSHPGVHGRQAIAVDPSQIRELPASGAAGSTAGPAVHVKRSPRRGTTIRLVRSRPIGTRISPMGKRVLAAVLWGLAVWTWVSMAHAFLGIPELGMIAGLVTAAVIVGWGFLRHNASAAARTGHIASGRSNRSGSHA